MVRKVIKGNLPAEEKASASTLRGDRKVIDRRVYDARQKAAEIKKNSEEKAEQRRQLGQAQAAEAYQNGLREGSMLGERQAAETAIEAYGKRADTLREAIDDCMAIARQIGAKILGPLTLREADLRRIAKEEIEISAERRHLRIDFATGELERLRREAPEFWRSLESHPEFNVDSSSDLTANQVVLHSDVGDINSAQDLVQGQLCQIFKLEQNNCPKAAQQDGGEGSSPN